MLFLLLLILFTFVEGDPSVIVFGDLFISLLITDEVCSRFVPFIETKGYVMCYVLLLFIIYRQWCLG